MRNLLFLLLIPLSSLSQYNYKVDTNCYSSQHIAIPNDTIHRAFFEAGDKMDLFETVYYLNRKHLLNFRGSNDIIGSCCVGMFNDYRSKLTTDSTQHAFHDSEMSWDVQIYGFVNFRASMEPLMDENYFHILTIDADGNYAYVYAPIDTTYFGFVSIPEIRIEERMLTEDEYLFYEEGSMKIERFQFTAFEYSGKLELFWVDFLSFKIALEESDLKPENLPWYDMLMNRSYGGFRYKQTACDDPFER